MCSNYDVLLSPTRTAVVEISQDLRTTYQEKIVEGVHEQSKSNIVAENCKKHFILQGKFQ